MLVTNRQKFTIKLSDEIMVYQRCLERYLPNSLDYSFKFQHYDVTEIGLKYNLIDLNSSLGIPQLEHIEKLIKKKNLHNLYKKLKGLPIKFQKINPYPNKLHITYL